MTGRNYFAIINEDAGYTPAPDANGNFLLSADYVVPSSFLKGAKAIAIAAAAGVAGKVDVTIGGTYVVGDTIKITVSSNLTSRQKFVKSYTVEVTSALSTTALIAEALLQKIQREINAGLIDYPIASVSRTGSVVTITQVGDDKNGLDVIKYTDSAAGTVALAATATTISEGYPSDLVDRGIDSSKINLASYDTVKIELGIEVAQPFIDSKGVVVKELFWYGVAGKGAALVTAIGAL